MSNIDKRALREVAGKATPGPWLWINTGSFFSFLVSESNQDPHQCIIDDGTAWGEYGETINPESHDGVFIAAANPATVLALLDELEAKDKLNAELMEKQRLIDICQGQGLEHRIAAEKRAEAAEKRVAELEVPDHELKMAHLINKFYERYPLDKFKSDTERSAALGYFMAGAELQCFGEFINYAELMGDE